MTRPDTTRTGAASQRRRVTTAIAFVAGIVSIALVATDAAAQSVELQVERGPHYAGEAVEITIVAEGFAQEPQPEVRVTPPAQGALAFLGMSPSVQSSITIVNGQMRRTQRVRFVYRYRFQSPQAGRFAVGPFTVSQGATERRAPPVDIALRDVPPTEKLRIVLDAPQGPIFVGQKVPVTLEFWVERGLQENLHDYALSVPLFDDAKLRILDDPGADGDTDLQLQTAKGPIKLRARAREEQRDGNRFLVVSLTRTLMARQAGMISASAPTVVVSEATRWRRDLFGSRQASAVRKLRASGTPLRLEVAEVPAEGRPPSFAGAIGRGYTLEVSADRSVVQVGEPIALTFSLRGDGDLTTAALPTLDAAGLFDPQRFRVPTEPPTGSLEDGAKHFNTVVRALDDALVEIPALEYSWFDADTRRFETTHSRPIALSVRAAEVIGARDVESLGRPGDLEQTRASPDSDGPTTQPRARSLALTGADLGIEREPGRLLRNDRASRSSWSTALGLHGLGLALVGFAWLDRRRRDIDPKLRRRRKAFDAARAELERALGLPEREGAAVLGRALRSMHALAPTSGGPALDELLGECDARSYAPEGTGEASLPEALCERAQALAAMLEEGGS